MLNTVLTILGVGIPIALRLTYPKEIFLQYYYKIVYLSNLPIYLNNKSKF
jgi:hypothetical protein